jgi:hypothetical protein
MMIDVKAISAQELEAQRKISEAAIKRSKEGQRLAAINAELAERKKEGKRKALDSFANYQKTSGKVYMPFVSPLSGETERGLLVPWKLTERNQTAKTVLAVSFNLG